MRTRRRRHHRAVENPGIEDGRGIGDTGLDVVSAVGNGRSRVGEGGKLRRVIMDSETGRLSRTTARRVRFLGPRIGSQRW